MKIDGCLIRKLLCAATGILLTGCGGADLMGNSSRSGGLDSSGLGGNYSGYGNYGAGGGAYGAGGVGRQGVIRGRGTYPKVEASFELGDVKGNPFDFAENDVIVTIAAQDGHTVKVPAFFDGG